MGLVMHQFKRVPLALGGLFLSGLVASNSAHADSVPQILPFVQNWSSIGLVTASDDWSGVPGIVGYRGDNLTAATGADPRAIFADGTMTPLDVNANQTNSDTFTTGGVTEFHLADPTMALSGSGTADAPFLLISLDTTGKNNVLVAYTLRDLDGSSDDAIQRVALQYRVGSSGNFIDLPGGYVADATDGGIATRVTPVSVTLPADANNQPLIQLRVMTTNAVGNDEWVGIDDIAIDGGGAGSINHSIVPVCPANVSVVAGSQGSAPLSASDVDSVVNGATITTGAVSGITLGILFPAAGEGATASVSLDVSALAVGSYPVTIRFANDDAQSAECALVVTALGITHIYDIQGSGTTSPLTGQSVTTEGVVSKLNNNGFYLQDEVGDGNPATSDGVFVFTSQIPTVQVGDRLRLTANIVEFNTGAAGNPITSVNTLTELTTVSNLAVLGSGTISPVTIPFPESVEGELERYEGMLVRIDSEFTVSQNFFLGRFGQVTLGAGGHLIKPTNAFRPGTPENAALVDANARRRIVLDDSTSLQNPNPIPYIGDDNTLRAGDTVDGLVGVIDYGLATSSADGIADYRLHPAEPVSFVRVNARTTKPESVGGNIRVASFNVLNYFTTIDQNGAQCFPSMTRSDCRGADSVVEFNRQQDKIVAALAAIDADAVGLIEIENNGNVAVDNLVASLNARVGAGTYASVGIPLGGTGSDAIRVAAIYKPAKLMPVGNAVSDNAAIHNRPPLAQTFAAANGEAFTLVVNHFKSKGSCPADAISPDADQGDGQGCWNARRVAQAQALNAFLGALADPDVLVMGDLNAYGMEDPIVELVNAGYVDQLARFVQGTAYSFVFDGEAGYLDHMLASASLSPQVVGAADWHINADEPSVIDYNTEFKPQDLYAASAYRSSDHDPAVIGLSLLKILSGSAGRDVLQGSPGDDRLIGGGGADTITTGTGHDVLVYQSMRDAGDSVVDFTPGLDRLDLTALLSNLGIEPATAFALGHVRVINVSGGVSLQIDADGATGNSAYRPLVKLLGINAASIDPQRDIGL